jgi:hypothetical protein
VNDDQIEIVKWLGEFDYSRDFFAPADRTGALMACIRFQRLDNRHQLKELLLAYREHAQELLAAVVALEKLI